MLMHFALVAFSNVYQHKLTALPSNIFQPLPALRLLSLSYGRLTSLDAMTFANNTNLVDLYDI